MRKRFVPMRIVAAALATLTSLTTLGGAAHAGAIGDMTTNPGGSAPPRGTSGAGEIRIDPSNYRPLVELLTGYGRVEPFKVGKNGHAIATMTTGGEKYFFNVAGSRGKPCGGICDVYLDVCNDKWRKPTYDELNSWLDRHYSYMIWFKQEGTCLHLDMPSYGQAPTEKKLDNVFRIWLADFKELRDKFAN